ncbi:hypothetical protein [Persicirhabdus sediminis]|uniref:Uncharacterized protein n=1 Tax=Persicirhabdus sediminis TaxID=454144 RepID=A0A8J7SL46_9BACT|nr:hypothetical protein [Persicirhabdus sediminis]MBK1791185.1 hypothetical protein [Persicirhabdus sediminis]
MTTDEGIKFTLTISSATGGQVIVGNDKNEGHISVPGGMNDYRIPQGRGLSYRLDVDLGESNQKLSQLSISTITYSWIKYGTTEELHKIREFDITSGTKKTTLTGPFSDNTIKAVDLEDLATLPTDLNQLANWSMKNIIISECPTRFEGISFDYQLSRK